MALLKGPIQTYIYTYTDTYNYVVTQVYAYLYIYLYRDYIGNPTLCPLVGSDPEAVDGLPSPRGQSPACYFKANWTTDEASSWLLSQCMRWLGPSWPYTCMYVYINAHHIHVYMHISNHKCVLFRRTYVHICVCIHIHIYYTDAVLPTTAVRNHAQQLAMRPCSRSKEVVVGAVTAHQLRLHTHRLLQAAALFRRLQNSDNFLHQQLGNQPSSTRIATVCAASQSHKHSTATLRHTST